MLRPDGPLGSYTHFTFPFSMFDDSWPNNFFCLVSGFLVSGSIRVHSSGDVCQTSHHVDDKPGKVAFFVSHKPPAMFFFCVTSPAVDSLFRVAHYLSERGTSLVLQTLDNRS